MPKVLRCPKCTSKLIGVTRKNDVEAQKIIKKKIDGKELTGEEKKKWDNIYQTGNLVIVYGKRAAFVLAGRGIGPSTAVRILRSPQKDKEDLLALIYKHEADFARTREYWD